jgi:hypothetical protein
MKFAKYIGSFAAVALMLSLCAFAKDSNSGKISLSSPTRIGSTELAPGDYKVEWSGPADAVKINVVKSGRVVATAEGRVKNLDQPSPYNAVTTSDLPGNTRKADEIDFSNRKEALVLSGM